MPESQPTDPSEQQPADPSRPARPDWLRGAEPDFELEKPEVGAPRLTDIERARDLMPTTAAPGTPPPAMPKAELEPPIPQRDPAAATPAPPAPASQAAAATADRPWRAAASSVPRLPSFGQAPEPARVAASDDDDGRPMRELPDDVPPPVPPGSASRAQGKGSHAAVLPPLAEPWWMVAGDAVRTQRRAQLIAGAVVLGAIGLVMMLQQAPQGTPLSHIRREPAAWDGRTVTVSGRVDQAFPLAGGWAFYLVQGRDTMVTFTRSRTPVPGERVVVTGQINTGFLDGIPRQALFEQAPKPTN